MLILFIMSLVQRKITLRGQMVLLQDEEHILFMGTPNMRNVKDLTESGTYMSDIPIHDAMRDVILTGEQSRAQDSLKSRMDKLRFA